MPTSCPRKRIHKHLLCFTASFLATLDYLISLHPRSLIARELYGRRPGRRA